MAQGGVPCSVGGAAYLPSYLLGERGRSALVNTTAPPR